MDQTLITRRQYWLVVAALMAIQILIAVSLGWYNVEPPTTVEGERIQPDDPILAMLYNPLGMAIILLLIQFMVANFVLWPVAWAIAHLRR